MTRGDLGTLYKLRYVNFNVSSIGAEMDYLAGVQGIGGEGTTLVNEGSDSRDNKVRQGMLAIGDTVYYWKIAACPFADVYTAKSIGDDSVYISVTMSTYNFYTGADTITPETIS
jgi:hypothetical protein